MPRTSADRRAALVGWGLFGCFAVAGYSQAKVQAIDRGRLLSEASRFAHLSETQWESPRRGAIFSSDGAALAQSADAWVLQLSYERTPRSPAFYSELSAATGVPATELVARGSKSRYWRESLSPSRAARVAAVKRDWDADGVSLERSPEREYPMAEAASGLLGRLRDGHPEDGLEKGLDSVLRGSPGKSEGFVDRGGVFVVDKGRPHTDRVNGSDVVLTIDSTLQTAASQAVRAAVESNKAKSGCAVVIDPRTGDLLAVANWPSFDPAANWKPGDDYNMATMGAYEPGSTFKILTLAKALDDGVVGPSDRYYCQGQMTVGKRVIHCDSHHGNRAHGDVDLERAIAKSCNIAAANWAMKIGRERMLAFTTELGLFERAGLGLPGERPGRFNRHDPAEKLQLATMGFGQSMNCVPVNLAAAYASLGNDGLMMRPRLVKSLGGVETPLSARGRMVRADTAHKVVRLMESVIESDFGTGKDLRIPGYRLAGKTGTAQKVGTAKGQYVANFVGFVPALHPRAVVLVMVDSPSAGAYYGAQVAGPVFLDVAKAVIRRYRIPPTEAGPTVD